MILFVLLALLFLAYQWNTKKGEGKDKIKGLSKKYGKHYLDSYPGDEFSSREIIESHLEEDLRDCQYKEYKNSNKAKKSKFRFRNSKKEKFIDVYVDHENKKILSMWNPLHHSKEINGKKISGGEVTPEDEQDSRLRQHLLREGHKQMKSQKNSIFKGFHIFNEEDYQNITDEDLDY